MTDPITPTQADRDEELIYLVKLADWAAGEGFICIGTELEDPDEWCFRMWNLHGTDGGTGDAYTAEALAAVMIARYRIEAEERGAQWAIEAGKRDHIDWYRLLKAIRKEHGSGMSDIAHGIVATFDALDPKAICDSARETDDAA